MDVRFSDLNFAVPVVASDGHMVMVNNQNGETNLMFFQGRNGPNESFRADVVAGVHLTFSQLKDLVKGLQQAVDDHTKREK